MISSLLKKVFAADPLEEPAHNAYVALVTSARKPVFYQQFGVADTLDGRFDVIVLHLFLLTHRLKKTSPEFLRAIWEVFFSDMDRSLREMGASDTGIGKRVKKMAQAFYGRIDSYENTISDEVAFRESLSRNLYRGASVSEGQLSSLAGYVKRNIAKLENQDLAAILRGNPDFCD